LSRDPPASGFELQKNDGKKKDGNELAVASIDQSFWSGSLKTLHEQKLDKPMLIANPSTTNIQRPIFGHIPKSLSVPLSEI